MNPLLEGLLVSTDTLVHNAKLFDKGIKASLGSYYLFPYMHMRLVLISLSSKLQMEGLTLEPFSFCLS